MDATGQFVSQGLYPSYATEIGVVPEMHTGWVAHTQGRTLY